KFEAAAFVSLRLHPYFDNNLARNTPCPQRGGYAMPKAALALPRSTVVVSFTTAKRVNSSLSKHSVASGMLEPSWRLSSRLLKRRLESERSDDAKLQAANRTLDDAAVVLATAAPSFAPSKAVPRQRKPPDDAESTAAALSARHEAAQPLLESMDCVYATV
ncbi:unnamed protein product, partial [Aphanomyces euteiches]